MALEGDAWAQTLITVTPEEDATLREISNTATLSSTSDTSLVLDASKIVYRRSFTDRQFIDSKESGQEPAEGAEVEEPEERPKQDAENQTYLQGTPIVRISIEYKDEASQTMYMSSPCPPLKYFKDIMTSMKEHVIPTLKRSMATETAISFFSELFENAVMGQLAEGMDEKELDDFEVMLTTEEEAEMEANDILQFLIARAFWIVDPTSQREVETDDKEAQTRIIYNYRTNILMSDCDTQTDLTCEPKKSHTTLLTDYLETKNMILNCLEDCISRGIEAGVVIEDIMDEIIDKCVDRIKLPVREQITQTVASKLHGEKESDVLRRLRITMIVDPLEASIIVVPMMNDILQVVCDNVSKNASKVVKCVIEAILRRTMIIVSRLVELQKESQPKPISQKLEQRRKKILESMIKKETETVSTQTSLAGIYEVKRRKIESTEVICSICRRGSTCHACLMDQEDVGAPWKETKMLRTQDILLAYKPCYIVTKASEKDKHLQPPCPPVTKAQPPTLKLIRPAKHSSGESSETIDVFLEPERKIKPQDSINEWSHIIDATFMKACSMKESISASQTTTSSDQDSLRLQSTLASEAANALQILKDTFCNQETCFVSSLQSLKGTCTLKENEDNYARSNCDTCLSRSNTTNKAFEQHAFCTLQTCKPYSKLHLPKISSQNKSNSPQTQTKSHGDGFKIIPICISQSPDA